MPRKNMVLTPDTLKVLERMGRQIKKARLRRNIRAEEVAEQAGISKGTLTAVEKGVPTVSIGAYAAVLCVLGLEDNLKLIAMDEEEKRKYKNLSLINRERASRQK